MGLGIQVYLHHWCMTKYHNALGLSPQIFFQEKLETMLMQNLKEQTKSIMVFSEVVYTR